MISDPEYARAVAQFLSKKGVTRCPTACVVPTRASVSDADRAALRDHAETREAVRQARRHEFQQIISPRSASQSRYAENAPLPVTNVPASGPGNEASVSP
jgi:hypothetical protein